MSKREDILRKVQNLIARAESTTFEAEREQCLRRADDMMAKYAIDEWEARQRGDTSALKPEMHQMDFAWYFRSPVNEQLWSLFASVMAHCSCVIATQKLSSQYDHEEGKSKYTMPVFGLPQDLDYANMLFTSLYLQMVDKIQPKFDPNLSRPENVNRAKDAGMKWVPDICNFVGWPVDRSIIPLRKEYKEWCLERGIDPVYHVQPETHKRNYAWGFTYKIQERLREMRGEQEKATGSLLPALRNAKDIAREAMYDMFGDLRPHEKDCQCKACKDKRKPVRGRADTRSVNWRSMAKGSQAGAEARIDARGSSMPSPKKQLSE